MLLCQCQRNCAISPKHLGPRGVDGSVTLSSTSTPVLITSNCYHGQRSLQAVVAPSQPLCQCKGQLHICCAVNTQEAVVALKLQTAGCENCRRKHRQHTDVKVAEGSIILFLFLFFAEGSIIDDITTKCRTTSHVGRLLATMQTVLQQRQYIMA